MLDEDNDGEVSLGDITRAVFRRASERDRTRIRRFLEVTFMTGLQMFLNSCNAIHSAYLQCRCRDGVAAVIIL